MSAQNKWFHSDYAAQYIERERQYLQIALRQSAGPTALQVGRLLESRIVEELDLPFLAKASQNSRLPADLFADAAFLPFPEKSLSTVLLPHVLEGHELPHQVLREAHRVLQSDGHLVLTGFNPFSALGLQRRIYTRSALAGRYYTSRRVIDWLQLLGFEVVGSAMYQYGPLSKSLRLDKSFAFLESIGDRWLPMLGGAYMITAKKRDPGMTMLGLHKYRRPRAKLATAAPAKTSIHSNRIER
ncbi:MAG: SAM-dependent methyltransferase [Cryomorphaceae bacterium]